MSLWSPALPPCFSPPVGVSDTGSAGRDDPQLGYEHGPGEVVKPKPLPRMKLLQFSNGGGAEESAQLSPSSNCLGQDVDLKVEVTERDKVGVKSDAYIRYKICTEVREGALGREGWEGRGRGGLISCLV